MTLPLLPNQPFSDGDDWLPDVAYLSFFAPIFDDQPEYLGHRVRILDSELSNAPNAIKDRVNRIENGLLVTVSSGLTLAYQSGSVRMPDGSIQSIASGLVVASDNATGFVYVDPAGVVRYGTPTVVRLLLARVVTVAGNVTVLEDLRFAAIRNIQPITSAIKVFGGSNATDKVCTAGEVLDQGLYYFRNFTVPAGVSVTAQGYTRIICSGNVEIAGTINVPPFVPGGAIQGYRSDSYQYAPALPGFGLGGGGGYAQGGSAVPWGAQGFGNGGASGEVIGNGGGHSSPGGLGAGGIVIEAAGTITVKASGSIIAKGGNGLPWAIESGFLLISGGGGGSGGIVYTSSLTQVLLEPGATIDVSGGNGHGGVNGDATFLTMGGSAGGGGYYIISAPSRNITGANIILSPGINGADVGTFVPGNGVLWGGSGGGCGGAGGKRTHLSNQPAEAGKLILRDYTPVG